MRMKRERIFMAKPWDSLKNKTKTIHELSKEFPEKTYRQLEIYRDADRQAEAQRIIIQQEELEPIEKENWKEKYEKEHKLRKKAEKELIDLKKKTDPVHTIQKARESGL
jgi:hypothetical protein